MIISEVLGDLLLLVQLLFVFIYSTLKLWFKNIFIPSKYLYKKVDNEVVLITGAACGLGKALAKRFLNLNAIVICVDVNKIELQKTFNELSKSIEAVVVGNNNEKRLYNYVCDVASFDQVKILSKKINEDVAKNVTILINNAGIVNGDLLTNLTEPQIRRTVDVNTFGQFWTCKMFLESMMEANKGHIVNISSVCGFMGGYKLTDYCASKFASYGLTEALRVELKTLNNENRIVTSLVCPFHIQTNMFKGIKFANLNWLKVSMTTEYAADCVLHGILLEKEIIHVPQLLPTICHIAKGICISEFNDQTVLRLSGNAMDKIE